MRGGSTLRHIVHSVLGIVSSVIGTTVIFVLVARTVGPAAFGTFALSYATASFAGIIFDFGYLTRLLHETRRDHDDAKARVSGMVMWTKCLLFVVLSLLLFTTIVLMGGDLVLTAVLWTGIALTSVANTAATMLRALSFHGRDSANNAAANMLGLGLAFGLYFAGAPIMAFGFVFPAIGLGYLLLTLRIWRRECCVEPVQFSIARLRDELHLNSSYAMVAVAQRSFGFLDVIILSLVASPAAVGIYQAAQKISQAANIFTQPFNNVLLPRLSRVAQNRNSFLSAFRRFLSIQTVSALVLAFCLATFGPWVVELLYTAEFAPAEALMPWFAVLIATRYVTAAITISITALGKQRERMIASLFGVVVMLIVSPFLGWIFGPTGQVAALTISTLAIAVVSTLFLTAMLRKPLS